MKRKSKRYNPARRDIVRVLFFLNALFWLGFGIYVVLDMFNNLNVSSAIFVGIFMFGNAGLMIWSGTLLSQPQKWKYYFALIIILINIFYTLSVQFGFLDVITFVLDLIILLMLVFFQKEFLSNP